MVTGRSIFELDRAHPKYPAPVPVNLMTQMFEDRTDPVMDGKCRHPGYFGSSLGHIGTKSEWLSPTRLRVWPFVKPDSGYFAEEALGRVLAEGGENNQVEAVE